MRGLRRFALYSIPSMLVLAVVVAMAAHGWLGHVVEAYVFKDITRIPANPVALVLGCSPTEPNHQPRPDFFYRMDAAAELYRSGRVQQILASGYNADNRDGVPIEMKTALVERGVPASAITLDGAGYRTLDSVIRAKEVYGLTHVTIVSQPGHTRRAVYIARHYGIEAVGYSAQDVSAIQYPWTAIREYLAQVRALLDLHIFGTRAKSLGLKAAIGE